MPYRVDVTRGDDAALDRLVELGALDVDRSPGGGTAALMPDGVAPEHVARALGVDDLFISPAVGRDAGSVWILSPRPARAAAENARLNALDRRLQLARGGPDAVAGTWPLVVANLLAAPLVELAPVLVRHVGHHGRLVLSGIPSSVEPDVDRAYRRLGMQHVRGQSRAGWSALVLQASW